MKDNSIGHKNYIEIGYHVSDVLPFTKINGELDKEAKRRCINYKLNYRNNEED